MLGEIASHVPGGILCFLTLLVFAAETPLDIHVMLDGAPWLGAALACGAVIAFAPLAICVAVGSLRRGAQQGHARHGDDRPAARQRPDHPRAPAKL